MIERLRTNAPAGVQDRPRVPPSIYREGIESAMETEASARHLTMMLAGRAKNCAPALAHGVPLGEARQLLDVARYRHYSIACLQKNPQLRAGGVGPAGGLEDRSRDGARLRRQRSA